MPRTKGSKNKPKVTKDYVQMCIRDSTGTHESLVDATNFVKTMEQHQHRKIACLEEIAYLNGWISKDELMEVYEVMKKNQYGQYLKDVMDGKYQEHLY